MNIVSVLLCFYTKLTLYYSKYMFFWFDCTWGACMFFIFMFTVQSNILTMLIAALHPKAKCFISLIFQKLHVYILFFFIYFILTLTNSTLLFWMKHCLNWNNWLKYKINCYNCYKISNTERKVKLQKIILGMLTHISMFRYPALLSSLSMSTRFTSYNFSFRQG